METLQLQASHSTHVTELIRFKILPVCLAAAIVYEDMVLPMADRWTLSSNDSEPYQYDPKL